MNTPITTLKAKCRDCHRCIRACQVKAISLRSGQANVVPELCISCGLCVEACPQKAKTVVSQSDEVLALLGAKEDVIVSLAPSYAVAYAEYTPEQVIAGLRKLGFSRIEETALAAEAVAAHYCQTLQTSKSTVISSCCPAIVNLLEIYFPELMPLLSDSASPMVIHGRSLRARYPKAKVVFIGPCIAKIQEASRPAASGAVDAVLTFEQLDSMWSKLGINPAELAPMAPDMATQTATIYPLSRGILSTAGLQADARPECLAVSGLDSCIEVFKELAKGQIQPNFIEALACREGCIDGPGISKQQSAAKKRARLIAYHQERQKRETSNQQNARPIATPDNLPRAAYQSRSPELATPTEAEIRAILVQIGKHTPEDESNCGGCGYSSCRDKAIATYRGLAELEMCVPYMRAKFESLSHIVVDSSLNAIIVVTKDLLVHQLNPMADRLFNRNKLETKGQHLALFIDPTNFAEVADSGHALHKQVDYPELKLFTSQIIYPLPDYGLVIGIISDITELENKKQELDKKHRATASRAREVIRNQMKLAQEIAGLLGEATAETKATLLELIASVEEVDEL